MLHFPLAFLSFADPKPSEAPYPWLSKVFVLLGVEADWILGEIMRGKCDVLRSEIGSCIVECFDVPESVRLLGRACLEYVEVEGPLGALLDRYIVGVGVCARAGSTECCDCCPGSGVARSLFEALSDFVSCHCSESIGDGKSCWLSMICDSS